MKPLSQPFWTTELLLYHSGVYSGLSISYLEQGLGVGAVSRRSSWIMGQARALLCGHPNHKTLPSCPLLALGVSHAGLIWATVETVAASTLEPVGWARSWPGQGRGVETAKSRSAWNNYVFSF